MNKKTVRDIDISGKKVLVRCDFNVPQDDNGNITDNRRISESLETIKYLLNNNAKVILCSHLGRPKGEFNNKYSLAPVAKELSRLLEKDVKLATDVIGDNAKELISNMQNGEVVLLENTRFHKEEEENDSEFSRKLASLAEVYVSDAFGAAHRAHSSTAGVATYIPAVSGFLIEKELRIIGGALENPERPFVAIFGGKKVSDKIDVIENLLEKVDTLLIGGAMTFTFLKAQGYEIGKSICELDKLDLATRLLEKAKSKGVKMLLPIDIGVGTEFSEESSRQDVLITEIPVDMVGLDIGLKTVELFTNEIKSAKTIIWNGPLGAFELQKFHTGTYEIGKALADTEATTIIGGGDSAAAIEQAGLADKMTHISTGGGASLEFMEGKTLPGIDCLMDK